MFFNTNHCILHQLKIAALSEETALKKRFIFPSQFDVSRVTKYVNPLSLISNSRDILLILTNGFSYPYIHLHIHSYTYMQQ